MNNSRITYSTMDWLNNKTFDLLNPDICDYMGLCWNARIPLCDSCWQVGDILKIICWLYEHFAIFLLSLNDRSFEWKWTGRISKRICWRTLFIFNYLKIVLHSYFVKSKFCYIAVHEVARWTCTTLIPLVVDLGTSLFIWKINNCHVFLDISL